MKVLVVVAKRFNGHELWTALGVMQQRGHTFEVISMSKLIADEVTGYATTIQRTLPEVKTLRGFDALMFVSGNMQDTEFYWSYEPALDYVREAKKKDLPIAAICCSVPIIREAAKGKTVSFFPLVRSRALLTKAGATLSSISITVDGKLVTAEHQMATQVWAELFCDVLEGKDADPGLVDSGYRPMGRERKPIPELEHIKKVVKTTGKRSTHDLPSE